MIFLGVVKTTQKIKDKNIRICCTWREDSDCENCSNNGQLDCKWEQKLLMRFMYAMLPSFALMFGTLIVGGIFVGAWWWIGVVVGYYAIFFIVETRILCSHCPYYSEEGVILHCLANHGFIKFYRYHPGPMSKGEKTLLIFGFILFAAVPLGAEIYYIIEVALNLVAYSQILFIILLVLLGFTAVSITFSFTFLFTKICPKCVNFSCPFNKATKEQINKYLEMNPVMKQAWIDCGYEMEL
jgi:hypothetical protein